MNFYICNDEPEYNDLINTEFNDCLNFYIENKKLCDISTNPDCIVDFNNSIKNINKGTLKFFNDSKFEKKLFFHLKNYTFFPASSILIQMGSIYYIYSILPYNVDAVDSKQYVYKCIYNSLIEIDTFNRNSEYKIKTVFINTTSSEYINKFEFIKMFKLAYCHYIDNINTPPDINIKRDQQRELEKLLRIFEI